MTADVKLTKLATVEDTLMHMQRGSAVVSIRSHKTDACYSYSIKESNNGKAFYVTLLTEGSPAYLGSIIDGQFKHTDKSRLSPNAPPFKAFAYVYAALGEYRMPQQVTITAFDFAAGAEVTPAKLAGILQ